MVTVMQSMAVLLLEMAYEGKHMKGQTNDIVDCIKRLIRWLRTMAPNDAVAARAYHVVWKILKTCAPALRTQADELLAEDADLPGQSESHQDAPELPAQQDFGQWPSENYLGNGPPTSFGPGFSSQPGDQQAGYNFSPYSFMVQDQSQLPLTFGNPFVTSFDEGAPVVNMQDLRLHSESSGLMSMDFSGMSYEPYGTQGEQQDQIEEISGSSFVNYPSYSHDQHQPQ